MVSLLPEKTDAPLECVTVKQRATPAPSAVTFALRPADLEPFDPRVDVRIAAGEIPPRPTGEGYAAWYDEHVACTTPNHRYFVRERGEQVCSGCLGR